MNCLTVATDCPSCGAPLDFTEGSNAITCRHCGSNLLVTGRKQLLSYAVSPNLDEGLAVALAIKAQRDRGLSQFRDTRAGLYFLPYYRMTGQDFAWEEPSSEPSKGDSCEDETGGHDSFWIDHVGSPASDHTLSLGGAISEFIGLIFDNASPGHPLSYEESGSPPVPHIKDFTNRRPTKGSLYEHGEVVLHDRYIEKNFLACDLQGEGLFSLGVRPAVLRLELFRREMIELRGKAVRPSMDPDRAQLLGMKTAVNPALLYHKVLGKILSIIYFPFWIVGVESEGKRFLTIVDAVSRSIIRKSAPSTLYKILDHNLDDQPSVIGFRPLACPNCGWDLPVKPADILFFCKTCGRAWQIHGSDLHEMNCEIADIGTFRNHDQLRYLPFWVIQAGAAKGGARRLFIPAFSCRRLKLLLDTALRISRTQPSYALREAKGAELSGCYYDRDDAFLLAQFTQAALTSMSVEEFRTYKGDDLSADNATLIWFPFEIRNEYLVAPFGNISIPKNLLL